jgi:hypothetical protein
MKIRDQRGFLLLNGLTPRDRRAILVGLAVLVPVAAYVFGVKPFRAALGDVRDRVEAEQNLLSRELSLVQAAPSLPGEIQRAEADAAVFEAQLVQAESGELAESHLTGFLESSASRSRVLLEEIRSGELGRGEEPPPGLVVVRLHLRGESDLEGVLTFLDEIEKSPFLLRIGGLALEPEMARPESNADEEGRSRAAPTGVVDFQLIVDGFAQIEEQSS